MMKMILIMGIVFAPVVLSREATYAPDAYGYQALPSCDHAYLDISNEAVTLSLTASGADPAGDEGGAVHSLTEPFVFYQQSHDAVVISSNGYLAFADSLSAENGGDFSNDCLFPSVPDNQPESLARIMPFHDDLEAGIGGIVQTAYYASCPRPGTSSSSCSVFEWKNWQRHGETQTFDFQIILYHQISELALQYNATVPASTSASIGFQDARLFSGVILSCDEANPNLASQSMCFQNPLIFANGFE